MSRKNNTIGGFTIARNVIKFQYPFRQWAQAMANLSLDEVVIGYDPTTEDGTHELLKEVAQEFDFRLFESPWDMDNFERGTELGIQTDKTMEQLRSDWHLYVQLDEAFHEDDAGVIRTATRQLPGVTGVDFTRVYFFGDLHTIRKDWSVKITRLTRKDTHTYSDFDGMNCRALQGAHAECAAWMFHYSRIGDPNTISKRIRNMDTFYHHKENLIGEDELTPYDFKTRRWDNYSKIETPPEVTGEFLLYQGTHPLPFAELYQDFE